MEKFITDLNSKILAAAETGHIYDLKRFIKNKKLQNSIAYKSILSNIPSKAALHGQLKIIQYFLHCEEFNKLSEDEILDSYNRAFLSACQYRKISIIKYLLTDKQLKYHADIHTKQDAAIKIASGMDYEEIIVYLLSSKELKEHININALNNIAIRNACLRGNLSLVQYLLTSSELKEHADIYAEDHQCFDNLCMFSGGGIEEEKNMTVLKWLLTNYNIKFNDTIIEILNSHSIAQTLLNNYILKKKLENKLLDGYDEPIEARINKI